MIIFKTVSGILRFIYEKKNGYLTSFSVKDYMAVF